MSAVERRLIYRHRQSGLGLGVALLNLGLLHVGGVVAATRPRRRGLWWQLPWLTFYAALAFVLASLLVEVDEDTVQVSFTAGVARRTFKLAEIEDTTVVRVPWYTGWGIRCTGRGWLYSVWGLRAVELALTDDRRFLIGTDEPDALKAAIDAARAAAGE